MLQRSLSLKVLAKIIKDPCAGSCAGPLNGFARSNAQCNKPAADFTHAMLLLLLCPQAIAKDRTRFYFSVYVTLAVFWCNLCYTKFLLRQNFHETLLVVTSPLRISIVLLQMAMREECLQTRNQDFMWEGANEAKVDQTTQMYFSLSDPFI